MRDTGSTTKDKGKELLSGMIKISMKDYGLKIRGMDKEYLNLKMAHITENGKMIRDLEKEK